GTQRPRQDHALRYCYRTSEAGLQPHTVTEPTNRSLATTSNVPPGRPPYLPNPPRSKGHDCPRELDAGSAGAGRGNGVESVVLPQSCRPPRRGEFCEGS